MAGTMRGPALHPIAVTLLTALALTLPAPRGEAEEGPVPGRNVNMVGGPVKFKLDPPVAVAEGDPFLQRQNEPSCAVMTRNGLRIFCGSNDYRTVDLPGLPEDKLTRDAWLGYYWSVDGGDTWRNRLLPGFPQDTSPQGLASPIHGLQAGADATLRAGVGDVIYYSGIAFNRDAVNSSSSGMEGKQGVLFVARFDHPNLANDPEPFRYLDTRVVDTGSSGRFLDKPWLAVDSPRGSATCNIQVPGATPQSIPAGNVYVGYSVFVGNNDTRTKILFARSTDCGATWSNPTKLSEGYPINQAVSIGIDPRTGWVYVVWRQIRALTQNDGILYAVSKDFGATFSKAAAIASLPLLQLPDGSTLSPFFDQDSTSISIRTVAFPHIAVGDSGVDGTPGPVYVTWSQRWPQPEGGVQIRDARAVLSVGTPSSSAITWSAPTPIHNPSGIRGHQIQPTAEVAGGKLSIAYLYLHEDHTAGVFTPVPDFGPDGIEGTDDDALLYSESREAAGDLTPAPGEPTKVFTDFLADRARAPDGSFTVPLKRRHTIDTWLSQADLTSGGSLGPAGPTQFKTVRVSRYPFGKKKLAVPECQGDVPPEECYRLEQLQYSPPNYRLFSLGGAAFIGDYIDIGRQLFRRAANGTFVHHTAEEPGGSPVIYVTWTDNRDVRPPVSGDWTQYTPLVYPELEGHSVYDPTQPQPVCDPTRSSRTGMRNQNVYASRITQGLFVSSLTNQKPLSHATFTDDGVTFTVDEHVFPVTIDNETDQTRTFRVILSPDPTAPDPTATASFDQFSLITQIDLKIFRRSSVARNAFVRSSNRKASFKVSVFEIDAVGAPDPTAGGLQAFAILNPDPTAPDPTAPDPTAPDPTATEVYTVDLAAPDPTATGVDVTNEQVLSPDPTAPDPTAVVVKFPDPTAPDPTAPDPTAPDPTAPDPTAFDVANPDVTAPDPTAPDPTANALTDTVFKATNTGDSAAAYKVKLFLKKPPPPGFRVQLILNTFYATPAGQGCQPGTSQNPVIIANIPDPAFVTNTTDLANPDPTATAAEDAGFTLGAGQSGFITVRIFDPDRSDNVTFTDPTTGRTITIDPDFNPAEDVEVAVIPPVDNVDAAQGITDPPIATSFLFITTGALPSGTAGTPYTALLRASGNVGSTTWSIVGGSLAPGLTLDPVTGAITGTPTTAGTFPFTVHVQDSGSPPQTDTRALSITVLQAGVASLAFVQQPTDTLGGATISPPVSVRAIDGSGAAIAGVTVQVAIGSNPGGGTLSGATTAVTGSDGVAVFASLSINSPGTGYTLVATASGPFAAATSVPFRVFSAAPTALTFTVSSTNDSGPGSLRQALLDANANPGATDTILFAIPGAAPHTITPLTPLPGIEDPVLIDAAPAGDCDGSPPTIEIDGVSAGLADGLFVATGGTIIRGLSITRFSSEDFAGIFFAAAAGNVVECSYLGLAPDGATVKGNFDGIRIGGSFNNTVGGTTAAVRNVISGNIRNGVLIRGPVDGVSGSVMQNVVQGNLIGTDATGTLDRGNGSNGVHIINSASNTVGGAAVARNVISGNAGEGVRIDGATATANLIQNNYIGTDASGTAGLGNDASGVYIRRAPSNSVILNVVSGNNGFAGVALCGNPTFCGGGDVGTQGNNASGNGVFSNLIGTTADQSTSLGNSGRGVSIDGAPNTVVGGNLITASGLQGVVIFGPGATGNRLLGNNVHSNLGLGIDLGADGVTANDTGDTDTGPNGLQNFPVLTSAMSFGGTTTVQGVLNGTPNTEFEIHFFFSSMGCDPSGNGEGQQIFGSLTQSTDGSGDLSFNATFSVNIASPGTVVTAVATSPVDGSSEFSACVTVTNPGPLTFTVTNTNDSGPGSLRQAMLDANANSGFVDTITFAIPGLPPHTITPASALPTITDPVLIDAPASGDCNGAPPTVEIDGVNAGSTFGLLINAGNSTVRGLAITRFGLAGIFLNGSGNNTIECSYLGLAPDGVTAKGNNEGVLVSGSNNNTIGGTSAVVRNVMSANTAAGINIGAVASTGNRVLGNYIGTTADGGAARGNGSYGLLLSDAPGNFVGGTVAGAGNVVSGSGLDGIVIQGASATGNQVLGNYVGLNAAGTAALANGRWGVRVESPDTIVGAPGAGNVVSGNVSVGIVLRFGSVRTLVRANRVGTNPGGNAAIPNSVGITFNGASEIVIGGLSPGEGNLISGNATDGIIVGSSSDNRILGNLIGTDVTGTLPLGNQSAGIYIQDATNTIIGGTTAGAGNVISGSGSAGIRLASGTSGTVVQGNFIGTNAGGTGSLPNSEGFIITSSANLVGGSAAGAGNVISGNAQHGVWIFGAGATGNLVQGNFIGTDAAGAAALGNALSGVSLESGAAGNTIGGTDTGVAQNVIAFNGQTGIQLASGAGTGNWLRFNRIHSNSGLGIDLGGDGVTANDTTDPDSGPNDLQNFPVIASATSGAGTTTVQGTLSSTADTTFVIDFFNSPGCDLSGNGEGQTWFGSLTQSTDANGDLAFNTRFGLSLAESTVVTAIATSPGNSTSEFSACVTVTAPIP